MHQRGYAYPRHPTLQIVQLVLLEVDSESVGLARWIFGLWWALQRWRAKRA